MAYKDGGDFDPFLVPPIQIPALTGALDPRFAGLDGHSHFPILAATNESFGITPGADLRGEYLYDVTLTDSQGNGWRIQSDYRIDD